MKDSLSSDDNLCSLRWWAMCWTCMQWLFSRETTDESVRDIARQVSRFSFSDDPFSLFSSLDFSQKIACLWWWRFAFGMESNKTKGSRGAGVLHCRIIWQELLSKWGSPGLKLTWLNPQFTHLSHATVSQPDNPYNSSNLKCRSQGSFHLEWYWCDKKHWNTTAFIVHVILPSGAMTPQKVS